MRKVKSQHEKERLRLNVTKTMGDTSGSTAKFIADDDGMGSIDSLCLFRSINDNKGSSSQEVQYLRPALTRALTRGQTASAKISDDLKMHV